MGLWELLGDEDVLNVVECVVLEPTGLLIRLVSLQVVAGIDLLTVDKLFHN